MGLRTYLKKKKDKALSKFNRLQDKVISKFDSWKKPEDGKETHCFIDETEVKIEECTMNLGATVHQPLSIPKMASEDSCSEPLEPKKQPPNDSRVVTIIVKEGKIIEKVYSTPQGKRFSLQGKVL